MDKSRPRYVVQPLPDGGAWVLDRVNRGVSDLYTLDEARDLADWLNWRDSGYRLQPEHH